MAAAAAGVIGGMLGSVLQGGRRQIPRMSKSARRKEAIGGMFDPGGFLKPLWGAQPEEEEPFELELPEFQEPEHFAPIQKELRGYGTRFMAGKLPAWLKDIAEPGGKPFQDVLDLTTRDITRRATESAVRRGMGRGGPLGAAIAASVGEATTKLRWQDMLRALEGKRWAFGQGRGITEGVRGADLNYARLLNQFALQRANLESGFMAGQLGRDLQAELAAAGYAGQASSGMMKGAGSIAGLIGSFMGRDRAGREQTQQQDIALGQRLGTARGNVSAYYNRPTYSPAVGTSYTYS